MIWLKSCPRCQTGDMFVDADQYGVFRQCIQCSHIQDLVHKDEAVAQGNQALPASGEPMASLMMGLPAAS